ncbi:alpha/beta fold hydrolase [Ammoniphilus sp. YIM 78166]|uniref:alpha/beta fold hydrolase n=1 Tax=Ammoniphilus sp. YIM 78166 TaxID=1644106 RepID=UPI001070659D|nr:alpha/beta hydrolase [Ammoniphilus sp. YIM 78166]
MESKTVQTNRLQVSYLEAGEQHKPTVLLIHGNVSSSVFWETSLQVLSKEFRVIAPDLRGYGNTEAIGIDGTRGLRDWSDDLRSFILTLDLPLPIHLAGWSMGGGVVMQYAIDHAKDVASLILINPVSPFGFGGTKDAQGTPCYANYAGSGGGTANPLFAELLSAGDKGEEQPHSPRNVLRQFYMKSPFRVEEEQENRLVSSMLKTKVGEGFYPGSFESCQEWPGILPGRDGINNAMSPKYMNLSTFADLPAKVPVLWIRGAEDPIVSDTSFFDMGYLGKLGLIPGWPGDDVYPPQPMVTQMRTVLDQYAKNGGSYEEWIVEGAGHSPHLEQPELFHEKVLLFLK